MKVYQVKEASIGCHFSYIIDDSNKGKKVMTKESTIILQSYFTSIFATTDY